MRRQCPLQPVAGVEDSRSGGIKEEIFEVGRMITECLTRYNDKIPIENIGGFDDDEDVHVAGGDEFGEEDLTNVLHESEIPLYEGARTTRLVATLFFS